MSTSAPKASCTTARGRDTRGRRVLRYRAVSNVTLRKELTYLSGFFSWCCRQRSPFLRENPIPLSNADDLGDYRPGLQAAKEHRVRSPLAEAGLTKADVRELSKRLGLPTFDKPASPCLSSRVQYGEAITPEKLRMIESAEAFLRDRMGLRTCRVRHHHNIARIEVPPTDLVALSQPDVAARIDAHFRSLGYAYVTLDLRGFRSGSMNEVIAFGKAQSPLEVVP